MIFQTLYWQSLTNPTSANPISNPKLLPRVDFDRAFLEILTSQKFSVPYKLQIGSEIGSEIGLEIGSRSLVLLTLATSSAVPQP